MEYRLSPNGNQYLKLYYNQNVYDWLDGYTGEYGVGYIWRRKLDSLLDIFKKQKAPVRRSAFTSTPTTIPTDSIAPTTPTDSIAPSLPHEAP
jgi:hypothetical protein